MTIKDMMEEIANAQDRMYNIDDIGAGDVMKHFAEEIDHACDVMMPL